MDSREEPDLALAEVIASYSPGQNAEFVAKLFDRTCRDADYWIRYYASLKNRRRWISWGLRGPAVILAGIAAVLPVWTLTSASPTLSPAWATVALVIGAVLVGFDHYLGFSHDWIRFVSAQLRLRQAFEEFQADFLMARVSWKGVEPDADELQTILSRVKIFRVLMGRLVGDETGRWAEDLQASIKELNQTAGDWKRKQEA